MLFDIAYYTAVSHNKNAHLRKFIGIEGASPTYFGFVGSKDYTSFDLIDKIQEKIERTKYQSVTESCFEIYQLKN